MPSFGLGSGSSQRMTERRRKSRIAIRPWRSPAARRRWEVEGSVESKSRWSVDGVQRTAVRKGEREFAEAEGGGSGIVEMSWRERE